MPFKEILRVDKIPISIWRDEYLSGFLITHLAEYAKIFEIDAGYRIGPNEFEEIIHKIDPDNSKLISLIGEYQFTGIEEGIKKSVEWFVKMCAPVLCA